VVLVEGVLEPMVSGGGAEPLTVAATAGIAVAVAVRRRVPLLALTLGFAALVVANTAPDQTGDAVGPFFALLLLIIWVGAHVRGRRFAAAVVIAAVGLVGSIAVVPEMDTGGALSGLFLLVGGPLFLGRFLGHRSELNRVLAARAEEVERDREDRARAAVAEERTRIASELHDAVAHALSGMVIQAAGARRLVHADPDRARQAFTAVEDSGREALGEMRRLLGVLRREDAELALDPQPSLAHLPTLLRRAREAGVAVSLDVTGAAAPLSAGLDLTAYRVVQAALGAAEEGEAHTASVRVRYGRERLEIEVADDGRAPAAGRLLLGVRERLAVHGGELLASDHAAGHAVRARIPLGADT
jgi:signal transduction histidine kinase